jgi:hypothetical protein
LSETPATEPATQSDDVEADGPSAVHCRHCGQPNEVNVEETPDWLCPACERYQDATTCPTCHQLARISHAAGGHGPRTTRAGAAPEEHLNGSDTLTPVTSTACGRDDYCRGSRSTLRTATSSRIRPAARSSRSPTVRARPSPRPSSRTAVYTVGSVQYAIADLAVTIAQRRRRCAGRSIRRCSTTAPGNVLVDWSSGTTVTARVIEVGAA